MADETFIRLLGPPSIRRGAESPCSLPESSARLLAFLVLQPRGHSREKLTALFWPEHEPGRARAALRNATYRLRKLLGNGAIFAIRCEVRLMPDPRLVFDVEEIERAVSRARQHHSSDEDLCDECRAALSGLARYSSLPLLEGARSSASADFDDWVSAADTRIEQQLVWARDRLAPAVARADEVDSGRRSVGGGSGSSIPPEVTIKIGETSRRLGNLPLEQDLFVGREEEIRRCAALMQRNRLVTIWGPGGVGKSRLSLVVARESRSDFPGGVWLVDLTARPDRQSVVDIIADTIGIRPGPRLATLDALVYALDGEPTLIILDNCEHLIGECAGAARAIASRSETTRILATSREPIGIRCEAVLPLSPLSVPTCQPEIEDLFDSPAVELFVDRATKADPAFSLCPENAGQVVEAIRRVEGLPLAIELLASETRALAPRDLPAALTAGTGGYSCHREDHERHRSIGALVAWSYSTLSTAGQALLQRLSVFGGSFDVDAVRAVCGRAVPRGASVHDWTLAALRELVDKSLVRIAPQEPRYGTAAGQATHTAPTVTDPLADSDRPSGDATRRYALMWVIREFAADRLVESGDGEMYRTAHLGWVRAFVEDAFARLHRPDWLEADAGLFRERNQITTALHWAVEAERKDDGLVVCNRMGALWGVGGNYHVPIEWYDKLLAIRGPTSGLELATAYSFLAMYRGHLGDRGPAEHLVDTAIEMLEGFELCRRHVVALNIKCMFSELYDSAATYRLALRSLRLSRRLREPWMTVHCRLRLVAAIDPHGPGRKAVEFQLARALEELDARVIGCKGEIQERLSSIHVRLGNFGVAERLAAASLANLPESRVMCRVDAVQDLSRVYANTGRLEGSLRLFRSALTDLLDLVDKTVLTNRFHELATLLEACSLYDLSARVWGVFQRPGGARRPRWFPSPPDENEPLQRARAALGKKRWNEELERGARLPRRAVLGVIEDALERLKAGSGEA